MLEDFESMVEELERENSQCQIELDKQKQLIQKLEKDIRLHRSMREEMDQRFMVPSAFF